MIVSLILIGASLKSKMQGDSDFQWISGLENSRYAKNSDLVERIANAPDLRIVVDSQLVQSARQSASTLPGSNGYVTMGHYFDPDFQKAVNAAMRVQKIEANACLTLNEEGNLAVARQRLEADASKTALAMFVEPLFDLDVKQGDIVSAFKVAMGFVEGKRRRNDSSITDTTFVRLAYAAAALGEVYPGQEAYCRSLMQQAIYDRFDPPKDSSEDRANVTAYFASMYIANNTLCTSVDYDLATFYLKKADEIYPNNPNTCQLLGSAYQHNGNFSEALSWYERGSDHATGTQKQVFDVIIPQCKWQLKRIGNMKPRSHPSYYLIIDPKPPTPKP